MEKLIIVLFLIKLLSTESKAQDTQYLTGNLNRIDWIHDSCTFRINEQDSPSHVENYRVCKILEQAYMRNQSVSITLRKISDKYSYSVNFLYRTASWANTKVEKESFQYQIFGTIEDVYYHAPGDKCYIAVDTGFANVRNNKHFHLTMVWDLCAKAINAFYSRDKVLIIATVDLHPEYSNEIIDLQVLNCQ